MSASPSTHGDEPSASTTSASRAEDYLRRNARLLEWLIAILLSVSSLATSWSGYQAGRWGGVQSTSYSQASAMRVESTRASNAAGQLRIIDVMMFGNWLSAYAQNEQELAAFYEERFRPEFQPAFTAWVASQPLTNPDAAPSPFDLPEYQLSMMQRSAQLDEEASATFVKGQQANQQSDDYVFNAVLMASVLFLGGMAHRFSVLRIRAILIFAAVLMWLIGVYNIATYPIW